MRTITHTLFTWFVICVLAIPANAQKIITLPELQAAAREHYPALKQKDIYTQIGDNKADELNSHFLPQITAKGQAIYQSEVTKFDFDSPDAPSFSQKPDQYSLGVEIREDILDYGQVRTQKEIETTTAKAQAQQVEVDFQKVKEKINLIFGNISLQQANKAIQLLRISELEAKSKKIQSAVENGAALQSSYLVIESEYYTTRQHIVEINSGLNSGYHLLSLLTGLALDSTYTFQLPEKTEVVSKQNIRPEYEWFDLQNSSLLLRESMIHKGNLPKVFAFADGYIGRPGFNFLNNKIRPYGLVGLGLNWNITNYYNDDHERTTLSLNRQLIQNQKETFDLNLETTLNQEAEEIHKLEQLIEWDRKIAAAKTTIRKASSSQLDNGVITSSDYITDLNAESQAQFNLKLHEIQLIMAQENYNTTLGY